MTEECATLLSEALDLCVRARELDAQVDRSMRAEIGGISVGTKSATPALWIMRQYDTDLEDWENRAKKALKQTGAIG